MQFKMLNMWWTEGVYHEKTDHRLTTPIKWTLKVLKDVDKIKTSNNINILDVKADFKS